MKMEEGRWKMEEKNHKSGKRMAFTGFIQLLQSI